jgi:hypothetical protein
MFGEMQLGQQPVQQFEFSRRPNDFFGFGLLGPIVASVVVK